MRKKILLPAFVLVALVHLYVPANMILDKEKTIREGATFRFKTAPVDPSDPFIGKYINLYFDESSFQIPRTEEFNQGETIYVTLDADEQGFAEIVGISKERPVEREDYVEATVSYAYVDTMTTINILYPFDRFYMEESKALNAEKAYNAAALDSTSVTYALVNVRNGDAVIKDVLINGIPIREAARIYKDPATE
jgi:uncharacterized membrane-anchored protein